MEGTTAAAGALATATMPAQLTQSGPAGPISPARPPLPQVMADEVHYVSRGQA
jgi:hypothetical protein